MPRLALIHSRPWPSSNSQCKFASHSPELAGRRVTRPPFSRASPTSVATQRAPSLARSTAAT